MIEALAFQGKYKSDIMGYQDSAFAHFKKSLPENGELKFHSFLRILANT